MIATFLASMLTPGLTHVAWAVASAVFVWYLHAHKIAVPPELIPAVELLLDRARAQQQVEAHGTIQALSGPVADVVRAVESAVAPPAAK